MLEYFKKGRQILGMNSRNLQYVRPYNLARAKEIADDKLLTKSILKKNGIATSNVIAKIRTLQDQQKLDWSTLPESFALKPNRGFGGEGIVVVYGRKKGFSDTWVKADRSIITIEDLKTHIRNILDGSFSLSGTPDIAFFEERLQLLKLFKPYTFKGIPDIRVIVFNKVPVMAMLRLPTAASSGKANLQQGAIGVGIDLATGTTTTAVWGKSKIIEYLPGTRLLLSGIKIPYWKTILELAIKAQEISGLGFLGSDIAIDKILGPVIVELNARPGLSIQIANLSGLKKRLIKVADLKIKTAARGIRVGMDLFGGEIEEELEDISGRKIIGTVEKVKLIGKDGHEIEVEAKIDTGAYSSSIDEELAKNLGYEDVLNYFYQIEIPTSITRESGKEIMNQLRAKYLAGHPELEDIDIVYSSSGVTVRPKVRISFIMDNQTIISKSNIINRTGLNYAMIIGRRDLGRFLIDVSKI